MGVTLEQGDAGLVVVVDGDLGCPATLVALRVALNDLAYRDSPQVVVDLTAATGQSSGVGRVLKRAGLVLAHRGIPFHVEADPGLVRA